MHYEEFRKSIQPIVEEKPEWRELATFVPNKKLPVHNWFYYKEGFAKELVQKLITMFGLGKNDTVLDPFCGAGTTLLACRQNGISAIGYDVMPVSIFATRVKTSVYNTEELKAAAKKLSSAVFARHETRERFPSLFYRAFSRYALEDIAFLQGEIGKLDREVRNFFTLVLISASLKCSYAYKDGSAIKFRKRPVAPMRKMFRRVAAKMIKDLEKSGVHDAATSAEIGDARRLPINDETIDAVITSPPYLNQIDYTTVYSIEEFFVRGNPEPGVRAYIGLRAKESSFLEELYLPVQARLYFEDMNEVLKEMHRVLKIGGRAAIVVGNGYVDGVIDSDIILSYLSKETGFVVEKIFVLNTRFALEGRTSKKGILRESLIILRKQLSGKRGL